MEVDVYYIDDHLMVFHDERLERITDGAGYVHFQSFDFLCSLDAGGGQQIPTLEEVCDLVDARVNLNIELKGPDTAVPVAELITVLCDNGWKKDKFLISSFYHSELVVMKTLHHDINVGALVRGIPLNGSKFAEDLHAFSVHPSLDFINQQFVVDAHNRGLKVFAYAVDHPEDIAKMHSLGVDGVFTGFPERVLENYDQGDMSSGWSG